MSYAPDYTPGTSFADDETNNVAGRSLVKTDSLDAELADISASINALNTNQKTLQRDDGKLADSLVEPYALAEQTRALIASGGTPKGEWTQNTYYSVGDAIQRNNVAYLCVTAHNSGSIFTPNLWLAISGDGSSLNNAQAAAESAAAALISQNAAGASAASASSSAISALASKNSASTSATNAGNYASSASISATNSANSAIEAEEIAEQFEIAGEDKGSALVAFLQSGTGAVARTVQDKLRDVVSVKDFGAVGDGVTDDTAAIQAALNSAIHVVFPEGTYLCKTEPVMQTANGYAEGLGEVVLVQDTYGYSGIQVRATGCTIKNIKFKNLKTKTQLSESLANRYEGSVSRERAAAVYLGAGSDDFTLLDCNVYGFINGLTIHGGAEQAWQQNVASTYTTTSFVLAPADQRPDGYWIGAVGRIMTVSGGSTTNFVVTGYTSSTNTITFATQAAISSTNFYYYLYKGFTKNITVNNLTVDKVDFGIVGEHGEKIVLTELTAYEIEQTQQANARPHTIYITSNCKDVYAANMRTYKNLTGDAYKFRGVTNLSIEDGFSTDCRGSFTIENCFNASARNCSNFESGKTGTSAPCIGFITNSKNVFVENCALTVSTNYNGGDYPGLRPFGFLVTASGNTGGYVGFDQVYNEQVTIRNTSITAGNAVDSHYGVLIEGVVAYPSAINKYINIDGVTMFTNGLNAKLTLVRTMYSDYVTAQNLQVSGSGTPSVNVQADSTASNTLFLLNKDLANPNVINTGTNTVIHYVAETQSGTWTPVVYGTTNAGTNTYSNQFGTYYKIGNLVTVRCRVTLSGAMASTGQIRISGLPFTASYISGTVSSGFMVSPSGVPNVTLSSGEIFSVRIDGGANFVSLAKISNTGVANLSDTAFGSGFDLHFAITYMTS